MAAGRGILIQVAGRRLALTRAPTRADANEHFAGARAG